MPDGDVEQKPNFLFKASEWSEAYALNKETSFVFAATEDDEIRAAVHLAAERYFLERGLTFGPPCAVMAKLPKSTIDTVRARLPESWIAHRINPDFLATPKAKKKIVELSGRFASYLNAFHAYLGPQMVEAWVAQFPDGDLQSTALEFLDHIKYVEASEVVRSFERLLDKNPDLRSAVWIPLGSRSGIGKSSDVLKYDLKELKLRHGTVDGLGDPDIKDTDSLVFYDDGLQSGIQCTSLFCSWLGRSDLVESASDADPKGALPAELLSKLHSMKTAFAFHAAHPVGIERLKRSLATLEQQVFGDTVYATVDSSEPEYRVAGFAGSRSASTDRFVAHVRLVGTRLLMDRVAQKRAGWNEEQAKQFALGFSGLDLSIVFRHSISASTPVPLWTVTPPKDPEPWLPLFPRRRKVLLDLLDPQESVRLEA